MAAIIAAAFLSVTPSHTPAYESSESIDDSIQPGCACPSTAEAESMLSQYTIDYAVAEFKRELVVQIRINEKNIRFKVPIFFRLYNTKSPSNGITKLDSRDSIYSFLNRINDFDLVRIYETKESGGDFNPIGDPLVVIYRNGGSGYAVFDTPEVKFEPVCFRGWSHNLVFQLASPPLKKLIKIKFLEMMDDFRPPDRNYI